VLTTGLWAVLIGHKFSDDGAKGMLLFPLILTFTDIGMLILGGVVTHESRQQKRSGRQLPPSTPRAGGEASRGQVSGASAPELPQANPSEQLSVEAQRNRFRRRHRSARGNRLEVGSAVCGAACRNRTDDLFITSESLCRLS
jgi:hypothetical protein